MNEETFNFNATSSDGSAAKHSTKSTESGSLPKTPIPGITDPINISTSGETKPHVTPCVNNDPRMFYMNNGSPAHVNPSIFANPFQGFSQPFPPYPPNWYMQGPPPAGPYFPPPGLSTPTNSSEKTANESFGTTGSAPHASTVAPTRLNRINDSTEFSAWLKTFSTFLVEQGLDHVIPDETGRPKTPATNSEKQFILDVFRYFVPAKAYPKWFSDRTNERFIDLYDVIEHALFQENEYANARMIAQELASITYDCKSDPFFFEKKLQNLRRKGEQLGITMADSVLCDRISEHLSGPFKTISDKYELNYMSMTLTDLLNDIQIIYRRQTLSGKKFITNPPKTPAVNPKVMNPIAKPIAQIPEKKPTPQSNDEPNEGRPKDKRKRERLFHLQNEKTDVDSLRHL